MADRDSWKPPPFTPLRGMKPDTRSERWKAAEKRYAAGGTPEDLAIIDEEQAKWDAEHPECPRCHSLLPDCACPKTPR